MKQKNFFICKVCLKFSLFILFISIILFPRFLWRTDTQIVDINTAIKEKKGLEEFNQKGATPLIGAASQGKVEIVKKLLDSGANPNTRAQNKNDMIIEAGNTALHYALLNGELQTAYILLQKGASAFALNDNKNTPLYTLMNNVDASIALKKNFIDMLINKSNNNLSVLFNTQNKQGYTPIMRAAELRDENLVELILKKANKNIDFSLKNIDGDTVLDIARKNGASDTTIEIIIKAQKQFILDKKRRKK